MASVVGMRRQALAISFVLLLTACTSWTPQEPSLSGWPLGEQVDCGSALGQNSSIDIAAVARTRLDAGDRPVEVATCYREGSYLQNGSPIVLLRSGAAFIVAFTFTDGTRKGVGVHCGADCIVVSPPAGPPG